jgi:P-type Cu2+ transporter
MSTTPRPAAVPTPLLPLPASSALSVPSARNLPVDAAGHPPGRSAPSAAARPFQADAGQTAQGTQAADTGTETGQGAAPLSLAAAAWGASADARERGTALTPSQRAALDDPSQLQACTRFVETADGQREAQTRLLIGGIHCAACAGTIETALAAVPGVHQAEVSASSERAQVRWDPSRTRASELIEAVRRAGYGAFPDTGAEAVQRQARELRRHVWQLFVAAFCMMQVMMYATPAYVAEPGDLSADMAQLLRWASWVLSIPVLVFAAGPYFRAAWQAARQRRISMDTPVALGIAVTFVASSAATFDPGGLFGHEVYFDSLTMFVTFLLGARLLESRARNRAARALDAVMRRLPDAVERLDAQGQGSLVPAGELRAGDRVRVHAGQAFAADGVLLEGRTEVDESLLSGESLPVAKAPGDTASAGCINLGAPVVLRVERVGASTRYQRIVQMVERALTERPALTRMADRVAAPFLWAVLLLAGGAALAWQFIDPARAVWVAVSVLIVTCPCALSLGAPVALLAAAGQLARRGVLVQRLDAIEALAKVDTAVFDKTGTLTQDRLGLAQTVSLEAWPPSAQADDALSGAGAWPGLRGPADLLSFAATLAVLSRHPLARALAAQAGVPPRIAQPPADANAESLGGWRGVQEVAGQGLQAVWHEAASGDDASRGLSWRLGSAAWCGVPPQGADVGRPCVFLAVQRLPVQAGSSDAALTLGATLDAAGPAAWRPLARFEFDEVLRPGAAAALAQLRAQGVALRLLSGDQPAAVHAIAGQLDIEEAQGGATPQDKLAAVEQLQQSGRHVVMVGDGINDAPVLARADVSVAMGHAAALAQSRADFVMLGNRLEEIAAARTLAQRTVRIVRQNLWWALAYNAACVPLALAGLLPPWLAGLGMALSSLLVVLNATRLTLDLRRGAPAAVLQPAGA